MPYAILPEDPSVAQAVRRIAREEALAALAQAAAAGDLGPRVHAMRRGVKRVRGLLRLVGPAFPDARAEDAALADAARALADLRDAAVRLATLDRLARDLSPDRRAALLAPFREAAHGHHADAPSRLPAFAAAMAGLRDRSEGWRLDESGWDALAPGLESTWRAARRGLRRARRRPADEDHDARLHAWRGRVKDHWHQARLLREIWPRMMDPHIAAADRLGETLGAIHDLAVLRDPLADAPLPAALRDEARDLARLRRERLLARAIPLGRRLLADPAPVLADRWRHWWRLRRDG